MQEFSKENLKNTALWLRLIYMIAFWIVFYVMQFLIGVIAVFQFLIALFLGKPNNQLQNFGGNASEYIAQLGKFITFSSNHRPYPFSSWPNVKIEKVSVQAPKTSTPKAADETKKSAAKPTNKPAAKPAVKKPSAASGKKKAVSKK